MAPMSDEFDAESELRRQGLAPRTWKGILDDLKARLPPADWERFSRAHRNFAAYRSDATLARFYETVFGLGLQKEVNAFRFARLAAILEDLLAETRSGLSILDVGAGGGYPAAALLRHRAPRAYAVYDPVPAVRDELAAQGFTALSHPPPPRPDADFDLILCIDSLGEVNGDDDGLLARPGAVPPQELPALLEERYGFPEKLAPWKPYLAAEGRILLWEPFAYAEAFAALAQSLSDAQWTAKVVSRAPGRNYLEIRRG